MKRKPAFYFLISLCAVFAVSCRNDTDSSSGLSENIDSIVSGKYTTAAASATSIPKWGALNCHDPKLFQDTDGKYYVYSTDASIGNAHKTGITVRSSSDLMNWSCYTASAIQGNWDTDMLAWVGQKGSSDSSILGNNLSYTATTWAPTVVKQNNRYYMFHGIITDNVKDGMKTSGTESGPTAWIGLAISDSPKGPFKPAASYDSSTYTDSTLVRYAWNTGVTAEGALDGTSCTAVLTTNNTASYNTSKKSTDSNANWNDGFGAIDPEFVYDVADGSLKTFTVGSNECYAVTFGSWKGGIALIYVDAETFKPVDSSGNELDEPLDSSTMSSCFTKIAGGYGATYEGAQLIYNSTTGYYYVFVSMGELNYEYRVGVGRCSTIDGIYVDAGGTSMNFASTTESAKYHAIGGKIIGAAALDGEYSWRCPGGESILRTGDGKIMFACHSRTNFQAGYYFYLQCRQMFFTADGWPVLNQNEYYDSYSGTDEKLASLTLSDIAGTYDTILTVRGTDKSSFTPYGETAGTYSTCDETPTASKTMTIASDGTISGDTYSGTLALGGDGYTVTVTLKDASGASLGTFGGYVLRATDWARKGDVTRQTVTFTTIDSTSGDAEAGEYFWGNKHNY
jgi:arabinan endo-1,5-alpha-L-arabinosidase